MEKQITIKELKRIVGKGSYNNNEFANWIISLMYDSARACELEHPEEDYTKGFVESMQRRRDRLFDKLEELGFFK